MNLLRHNIILVWATLSLLIVGSYSLRGLESIENGFGNFGMKFSEIVLADNNHQDNIACFPYGLALLLSAIATRADDRVKNEIKSILNVTSFKDDYLIFQAQSIDIITQSKLHAGPAISVNMLSVPRNYRPQSDFERNVLEILKISWSDVNNNALTSTTTLNINLKMEINPFTNYLRQNVGALQNNMGLLLLANAINFRGHWVQPFTNMRYESFYGYSRRSSVLMMSQENVFEHGEIPELGIKFIVMPYAYMETSMVIIMPTDNGNIQRLGGKLQNFLYFKPLYTRKEIVELKLPKFNIEIFTSIRKHLEMLGLTDMFTNSGVFDIAEKQPLHLIDAFQNVIINIDDTITPARYPDNTAQSQFIVNAPFIALIITDNVVIASAKINNM